MKAELSTHNFMLKNDNRETETIFELQQLQYMQKSTDGKYENRNTGPLRVMQARQKQRRDITALHYTKTSCPTSIIKTFP